MIFLLLKSIVCGGVLMGYYSLFLRGKKLHTYNRGYLLIAALASLAVPFLSFKSYILSDVAGNDVVLLNAIDMGKEHELTTLGSTSVVTTETIAGYCYLLVSMALLLQLLLRIVWVYRLKNKGYSEQKSGYTLVYTDSAQAPFSFLGNLFWKRGMDAESTAGKLILSHELCHIRQWHTLDKLLLQLLLIAGWANPFIWLMRRELALQHEFIADEAALEEGDTDAFARMILQAKYPILKPDIIHPFFHSSIKRRLTMLTTNQKTRFPAMRMLLALPLLATLLLLLSFDLKPTEVIRATNSVSVTFDAGHGGDDAGATGVGGVKEKDLTLRICKKLAELAPEYNIKANLSRSGDNYLELKERVAAGDRQQSELFVAIHVDKSGKQTSVNEAHEAKGYLVMVSARNAFPEQSRLLASAIAPRLKQLNVPTTVVQKGLVVINESRRPAVLIECGDIDDEQQVAILTNDAGLESMCREILSGIADYSNSKK